MNSKSKQHFPFQLTILLSLFSICILIAASTPPNPTSATVAHASNSNQLYLPLIIRPSEPEIPSIFGVQIYGSVPHQSPQYLPHLEESRTRWIRVDIFWRSIEPVNVEPEDFNWTSTDEILSLALDEYGGYKLIATIRKAPEWAAEHPESTLYPPAYAELAELMHALTERYDGDGIDDAPGSPVILHWEMYNEPDGSSTSWAPAWGEFGSLYALMLQNVYPAVKSANFDAQVVFGGIAYDWFQNQGGNFVESFLDDALAAGAGNYFDVMNFHIYPAFSYRWADQGVGLKEKAEVVRTKLTNYGLDKPIIVTEAGWYGDPYPHPLPTGPEVQAAYVVQFYVQSLVADLDTTIWWMLYDPNSSYSFGLVTGEPPVQRPSFTAYQTAVDVLLGAEYVDTLPPSTTGVPEMEAYQLISHSGQVIYVAWLNPVDSQDSVPLRLPATQARLRTLMDERSVINDGDDGVVDGFITVWISADPVYVEIVQ